MALKTSEWSRLRALARGKITGAGSLATGAPYLVQGLGDDPGTALVSDRWVWRISLTGSVFTTSLIAAQAARTLTPVSCESGNKSTCIVFNDADVDLGLAMALEQLDNAAPVCRAGKPPPIDQVIREYLVSRHHNAVAELRRGDPRNTSTEIGLQLHPERFERIDGWVKRATTLGAKAAFWRGPNSGHADLFSLPSLYTEVRGHAGIAAMEAFAIEMAHNDTVLGSAAMLFTSDERRGDDISAALADGTASKKCFYVGDLRAPFGRSTKNGIGRECGGWTFDYFCDIASAVFSPHGWRESCTTTMEFIGTSHAQRAGLSIFEALPLAKSRRPDDFLEDFELLEAIASSSDRVGAGSARRDEQFLRIPYATTKLWRYLGSGRKSKPRLSVGVCRREAPADSLGRGRALGLALGELGPKVSLIASGALSHTFSPRRELRPYQGAVGVSISFLAKLSKPTKRASHGSRGEQRGVFESMGEYYRFDPEALFGNCLMMIGAVQRAAVVVVPEVVNGKYENRLRSAPGYIRFDRLVGAWNAAISSIRESQRIYLRGAIDKVRRLAQKSVCGDGLSAAASVVRHLQPGVPSKLVAVDLNCRSRVAELACKVSNAPSHLQKRLIWQNRRHGALALAQRCIYHQGEIAIVTATGARNVPPDQGSVSVAGHCAGYDSGQGDLADTDAISMLRVKRGETLYRLEPCLVLKWNFVHQAIESRVNGKVVPFANTKEMEWDPECLFADLARSITVYPGDEILSGTRANSRPVYPRDVTEVEAEGCGYLGEPILEGAFEIATRLGAQPSDAKESLSGTLEGIRNWVMSLELSASRAS